MRFGMKLFYAPPRFLTFLLAQATWSCSRTGNVPGAFDPFGNWMKLRRTALLLACSWKQVQVMTASQQSLYCSEDSQHKRPTLAKKMQIKNYKAISPVVKSFNHHVEVLGVWPHPQFQVSSASLFETPRQHAPSNGKGSPNVTAWRLFHWLSYRVKRWDHWSRKMTHDAVVPGVSKGWHWWNPAQTKWWQT